MTVFYPRERLLLPVLSARAPPPRWACRAWRPESLGVLPVSVGSIPAVEAIKLTLGVGEDLSHQLLAYDSLEHTFRTYGVASIARAPAE